MYKSKLQKKLLKTIEFALAKGSTPWSIREMQAELKYGDEALHYFESLFIHTTKPTKGKKGQHPHHQLIQRKLRPETIFSYMSYENARISQWIACIAIIIAIVSPIISYVYNVA